MDAKPDHPELIPDTSNPSGTPGESLRRARQALNYGIEDVAKRLHLPVRVVDGLEQDRYSELPEPPYVKGYIRSYARFLELDPQPLVARYEELAHPEEPSIYSSRMPQANRSHSFLMVWGTLTVVVIVAALLVNWWMGHRLETLPMVRDITGVEVGGPGEMGAESGLDEEPAIPPSVLMEPVSPTEALESPIATEDPSTVSPPTEIEPTRSVQSVEPTPADDVPPSIESVPGLGASRLTLSFQVQSWTEVYDADDNRLLFDLIKSGEARTLEGKAPFKVVLGNAEGVGVEIDGEPYEISSDQLRGRTARFTVGGGGSR